MFPFAPFLSVPKPPRRPRRRKGGRTFSSTSLSSLVIRAGDVRIEYVDYYQTQSASVTAASSHSAIHEEQLGDDQRPGSAPPEPSLDVPAQSPPKKMSLQTPSRPQTPSRASPRSASASNSRPASRPSSAQPPPQARVRPTRNRMFETSSAMMELFGGGAAPPRSPRPSPRLAEVAPQPLGASQNSRESVAEIPSVRTADSGICSATTSSASCFQRLAPEPPTVSGPSQFARVNALEREVTPARYEDLPTTSTAAAPNFHNVPDHDTAYINARKRSRWQNESGFNIITHQPVNDQFAPGPELPQEAPGRLVDTSVSPQRSARSRAAETQVELGAPGRELASESGSPVEAAGTVPEPQAQIPQEPLLESACCSSGDGQTALPAAGSAPREESAAPAAKQGDALPPKGRSRSRSRDAPQADHSDSAREAATASAPPQRNGTTDSAVSTSSSSSSAGTTAAASGHQQDKENRAPEQDELDRLQVLQRLERLVWARSEDGCGMAASGSGGGGGGGGGSPPLLIRGGQVVNDDAIFPADIFIEDGVIKQILAGLEVPAGTEIIDASGKYVLPAGIDVHTEFSAGVHADEFMNNSKAALVGGTATVIDVVIPGLNESLTAAVDRVKANVDKNALCNVGLSVSLQKWSDQIKKEVTQVVKQKHVNSFILEMPNDSELFEALEFLKGLGALARVYPENKEITSLLEKQAASPPANETYLKARPVQLEAERIHRLSVLSQLTNAPVTVLSTSSSEACKALITGRQNGALVFAEVPISTLAADRARDPPSQGRIPIRKGVEHSRDALELLSNGQLSVCVSGHRTPRTLPNRPPYGVIAVGERLPALWQQAVHTGRLDPMRFVAVTATNPAKLFNLYPRKGRIAVGADADLTVWNPQAGKSLGCAASAANDRSVFDGLSVNCVPEVTVCGGRAVYRAGKIDGDKPTSSKFLELQPDSPHVFSVVKLREKTFAPPQIETLNIRKESKNGASFSGHLDDRKPIEQPEVRKTSTKVTHPPGGRSSFW